MSVFRIGPRDAHLIPSSPMLDSALDALSDQFQSVISDADVVEHDELMWIDPEEGLTAVRCSGCGVTLSLADDEVFRWWQRVQTDLYGRHYDGTLQMRCCGRTLQFRDLSFVPDTTFGRFEIQLWIDATEVPRPVLDLLENTLGGTLVAVPYDPEIKERA